MTIYSDIDLMCAYEYGPMTKVIQFQFCLNERIYINCYVIVYIRGNNFLLTLDDELATNL